MRSAMAVAATLVLCFAVGLHAATAQTVDGVADDAAEVVWLEPRALLKVVEGESHVVHWFTVLPEVSSVTAHVEDERVARVDAVGPVVRGSLDDNFTFSGEINVAVLFIGYNELHVVLQDARGDVAGEAVLHMSVLLSYQNLTNIFTTVVSVLVAVLYVIMGATLNLEVIKIIAKKPLGPLVGVVCQYLFMPLIAFGLAKAAFPGNPLAQLGLFLGGCCPGGGASNMWTHLLGGCLDLSIMMTFISSVIAFATVPLWVLMLGRVVMEDTDFVIPYVDIAVLVLGLSFPCVIGILLAKFLPRVGQVLAKMLTPVTLFMVVFLFSFGVYSNLYVFQLFDATVMFAGFGLPTLGYLSGLGLAALLRLPLKDRIAISIETGIQNMTIAVIILKMTLESPAGDLAVVFPAAAVIMTPVPLIVVLIIRRVYLWRKGPPEEEQETTKKEEANGNVEAGGAKAVANGVKTEADGGKAVVDGGKAERHCSVASAKAGIENPGLELEENL
ncbi:uncharacterized sodium-dependent transporter YocS-like isoform X2 [Eriocheir sinensis]|nr:uncharacterized sodium-dependent transporter YocS-like isoform X2 [Eriocheir sinensis]